MRIVHPTLGPMDVHGVVGGPVEQPKPTEKPDQLAVLTLQLGEVLAELQLLRRELAERGGA